MTNDNFFVFAIETLGSLEKSHKLEWSGAEWKFMGFFVGRL
jgi:hypothetical protein